jgi:alpha-N-arabinofuranosidase
MNSQSKKILKVFIFVLFLPLANLFSQESPNKIIVQADSGKYTINKTIYGHFAEHLGRCIYDGIWVGEESPIPNLKGYRKDIVEALKELEIPVLRWPGGCFADLYHWKNGIGPKEERPPMMNVFWGEVVEDNSFGTHEFLDLCELLETEPYIAVNVGSGTPQEAYDWVEYVTSDANTPMANLRRKNGREKPWKVKYWGIGNENWGCGGNMTASYYADLFKRFSTYCWVDFKIASGSYGDEYEWTETLMDKVGDMPGLMKGLSLHHYTVAHTWAKKGSATDFTKEEWFLTIRKNMEIDEYVKNHLAIMDKYDPQNRISLMVDEWGNWHDVEPGTNRDFLYQQNTLRDAVTAAIYLNVFNNYCYRVKMANIAQTINVLQAMVLTKDDQLIKTPTFYVFKMFKVHFDALMLPTTVQSEDYTDGEYHLPSLSVSASKNKAGEINMTVANVRLDKDLQTIISLEGLDDFEIKKSDIITADKMNSYNDFGEDEEVNISKFDGVMKEGNALNIDIPSKSVMLITLK